MLQHNTGVSNAVPVSNAIHESTMQLNSTMLFKSQESYRRNQTIPVPRVEREEYCAGISPHQADVSFEKSGISHDNFIYRTGIASQYMKMTWKIPSSVFLPTTRVTRDDDQELSVLLVFYKCNQMNTIAPTIDNSIFFDDNMVFQGFYFAF